MQVGFHKLEGDNKLPLPKMRTHPRRRAPALPLGAGHQPSSQRVARRRDRVGLQFDGGRKRESIPRSYRQRAWRDLVSYNQSVAVRAMARAAARLQLGVRVMVGVD